MGRDDKGPSFVRERNEKPVEEQQEQQTSEALYSRTT